MWTGLGPNVMRNAIINAAELASYDQVKQVRRYSNRRKRVNVLFFFSLIVIASEVCWV